MKNRRIRCLVASVALAWMGTAHAASINTVPLWDGVTNISDFGPSVTQTYGQTITAAPDDTALLGFVFYARLFSGTPFPMRAKVYRWDPVGFRATGAPLFESAPVTFTGATFQPYAFTIPGGVPVTPGEMYVLFVTVSQDLPLPPGFGPFGSPPANVYANGQFVYQNNGANTALWTTTAWTVLGGGGALRDMAFSATMAGPPAPVPASGTWGLVILAAVVAAAGLRSRRART